MATALSLSKPKILAVDSSVIRIQHPDLSNYIKTHLGAQIAAAGTAMTVLDNHGIADNDWFIIGEIGDEKTEEDDVNGTVTRGTSITVTNTLKFAHEIDAPVIRILERGIKIYGAATDGGTGTLIASVDAITTPIADAVMIQWNKLYTEYNLISTDTTYAYYYVKFTDGTTDSSASDYVASTGLGAASAYNIIQNALDITGTIADDSGDITWPFLIRSVNDWQDYVTQWVDVSTNLKKNWSWEYITNDTSLSLTEMEDEYALSGLTYAMKFGETKQSVLNIRVGSFNTEYIPVDEFDRKREGVVRTTVSTAISASATSCVLTNTYEFEESGTFIIGADTITYTANTETTGTLSGCTGVDNAHSAGAAVWQDYSGGRPYEWTIYNGVLKFVTPPDAAHAGYPIRIKYIKKLTTINEVTDTTEIPFYNNAQYYVAYKIELKRGNLQTAANLKSLCDQGIQQNARSDKSYPTQSYNYYKFDEGYDKSGFATDWHSDITYY